MQQPGDADETPGLAFFYGGLVSRKNVLAIMMQSFVSMGWTTVIWFAVGYSLCFSGDVGGVIGNLDMAFLHGVTLTTESPTPGIPLFVHIAYQMMFAIITPALITGALRQPGHLQGLYGLPDALAISSFYFPFVHMIWGGGLLQQLGACSISPAGSSFTIPLRPWRPWPPILYVGRLPGPGSMPGPIACLWWDSAPGCSGSGGTASTPAASSGSSR